MRPKLLFIILLVNATNYAQIPTFEWATAFGDYQSTATSVAVDNTGNVYTAGVFKNTGDFDSGSNAFNLTANGENDFYITKYDSQGNFIWAKNFGAVVSPATASNDDQNIKISLDTQGNILFTGTFSGVGDFDPSDSVATLSSSTFGSNYYPGNFILKLSADGNFIWVKKITAYLNCTGDSIMTDADNKIYLVGNYSYMADLDPGSGVYNVTGIGNSDIYIVKLSSNGDFIWGKTIDNSGGQEDSKNIKVDANKNVYITGTFRNTLDLDPSSSVVEVTSNGEKDIFLMKLNSAGDFQWGKSIGGQDNDIANDISLDNLGNFFVTGAFLFTVDFDPGEAVFPITAATVFDIYLLKLDTNGNFNWVRRLSNSVKTPTVTNDAQGNIYVSSGFSAGFGVLDADPGPNVFNISTSPDNDVYFLKLDTNANFLCAFNYGDGRFRVVTDLVVASDNKIYYCGSFNQTGSLILVDLNPFNAENSFSSTTASYLVKLSQTGNLSTEVSSPTVKVSVYPNPASNELHIALNTALNKATVKIISLTGQIVLEMRNMSGNDFNFNIANLSKGTYTIQFSESNLKHNLKFIKN